MIGAQIQKLKIQNNKKCKTNKYQQSSKNPNRTNTQQPKPCNTYTTNKHQQQTNTTEQKPANPVTPTQAKHATTTDTLKIRTHNNSQCGTQQTHITNSNHNISDHSS
jgi:hypothetical protein